MDLQATLKALSDAKKRNCLFWTVQLLMVRDNNVDQCFFRHRALQAELRRRFLITERKLNQWLQTSRRTGGT